MEIDDNTPADEPAFTCDVSMWSFAKDFNLATRTAEEVFRRMHEAVDSSRFRGFPVRVAEETRKLFDHLVEESQVTWVTAAELGRDRGWLPAGDSNVERTLRMLFETVDVAARHFGADRVRLVFAFS